MRGRGIRAVYDLEIVIAKTGGRLRDQYHISESQTREREISFVICKSVSGEFSVDRVRGRTHFWRQRFCRPTVVFGFGHKFR